MSAEMDRLFASAMWICLYPYGEGEFHAEGPYIDRSEAEGKCKGKPGAKVLPLQHSVIPPWPYNEEVLPGS